MKETHCTGSKASAVHTESTAKVFQCNASSAIQIRMPHYSQIILRDIITKGLYLPLYIPKDTEELEDVMSDFHESSSLWMESKTEKKVKIKCNI